MNKFLDCVSDLGMKLEAEWQANQFARNRFPDLAFKAISEADCVKAFDLEQMFFQLIKRTEFPPQPSQDSFGNPPIQLFTSQNFYIEALVWWGVGTAIHDHSFQGAWQVLHGLTHHDFYQFEKKYDIDHALKIGQVQHVKNELLPAGSIRRISAGPGFIHRTLHIGIPTVSLVVRTGMDSVVSKQYDYFLPHVASGSFTGTSPVSSRFFKIVNYLKETKSSKLDSFIQDYFSNCPVNEAFRALFGLHDNETGIEKLQYLTEKAPWAKAPWAPFLMSAVDGHMGTISLPNFFALKDQKLRKLTALITSGMSHKDFLKSISVIFPEIPSADVGVTIANQILELTKEKQLTFDLNEKGRDILAVRIPGGTREETWNKLVGGNYPWTKENDSRATFDEYSNIMESMILFETLFELWKI